MCLYCLLYCSHFHVLVNGQCVREASLCQAVENFSLVLTCSPCNDKDTVQWSFSPGHQKEVFHWLSQQNKTLLFAAVNVTKEKASVCYQCQCGSSEVKNEMYSSVHLASQVYINEHMKHTWAAAQACA